MKDYRWNIAIKYSPDQPRVPAGNPDGGQWTSTSTSAITRQEASELHRRTVEAGGFTYNPVYDDSPINGYALSIYPEAEKALPASEFSEESIYQYLVGNRERFEDPETYVGGWFDTETGIVYLDVSVVMQDLGRATEMARRHNQEGIYDLGNGETIIVKSEEERRREVGPATSKGHERRGPAGARPPDVPGGR